MTAYFDEFPDIIAEGENEEEAKENLLEALSEVLQYRMLKNQEQGGQIETHSQKPIKRFEVSFS